MRGHYLKRPVFLLAIVAVTVTFLIVFGNYMLDKYSVPDKDERRNNLIVSSGSDKMSESNIAHELTLALSRHTNWDNLFLSDNFKKKYKNRENILDDVPHISKVSSGITYQGDDTVVIIFAEKKHRLFDTDGSDDVTTEYYFKYILDDNDEIDDLILLKKQDVYTINGEPIEGTNDMGGRNKSDWSI